jgi:hypothetical protein
VILALKALSLVSKTVQAARAIEKCGGDVVLPRPTMKITFRYAGPEVDSGSMDIEEVIEALQGFAGAYGRVANEIDAPETAHQVKVTGFDKGSFEVYLAAGISLLSQDGSPVRTFLNLVDSAKIIFEIIGNVILAKKETKGRKDYKVEVIRTEKRYRFPKLWRSFLTGRLRAGQCWMLRPFLV